MGKSGGGVESVVVGCCGVGGGGGRPMDSRVRPSLRVGLGPFSTEGTGSQCVRVRKGSSYRRR